MLSDLNYGTVDKKGKESVVHIKRLKKSYDQTPWKFEDASRPRQKTRQLDTQTLNLLAPSGFFTYHQV